MDGNTPRLESPRFSIRTADFVAIEQAIAEVGHAVIDDLWNPPYIEKIRALADAHFHQDDALFAAGFAGFPVERVDRYLSGCLGLEDLPGAPQLDREFFQELERTGIAALYRHFLRGNFFVERTQRVVRRVDPAFPLRFSGLHCDGQLRPCSQNGLRSKRELTLWTPLQNCVTNDTSRLLLLHRSETMVDFFLDSDLIEAEGARFAPIQLRPHQIREEEKYHPALVGRMDDLFQRLFRSKQCYAPVVKLGSAVLFDCDIWHGSYCNAGMTKSRLSLDFRTIGEYTADRRNRPYHGMLFQADRFPPLDPPPGLIERLITKALHVLGVR